MTSDTLHQTERLIARLWRGTDRARLATLNADPAVMRYFPEALTRAKSDAFFDRLQQRQRDEGFVFPAIERKTDAAFIGFVGLTRATFAAPITPAVEIGWRLAKAY
jgi:RimJ/RimL family protein N-acetyltransferase